MYLSKRPCTLLTFSSALPGDAGFVARPHTVAGFSKAFENATALSAALQAAGLRVTNANTINGSGNDVDIDAALAEYNSSQLSTMHKAVALGEQLGRGTVLQVPADLASWGEDQLRAYLVSLTDVGGKLNVFTSDAQKK
jgi:2-polyprenyl-6-methoxyphenol hydroxylase-like FAD-dependent oxidoreductase